LATSKNYRGPQTEAEKEYALERSKHQPRVRKRVMERDGNKCQACGSFEPAPEAAHFIDVVECVRDVDMEAAHDERIVLALCPLCHTFMDGRRKVLPSHQQYRDVLRQARKSIQQGELPEIDGDYPFAVDVKPWLSRAPTTVSQINEILRQLKYEAEDRGREIRIISADYLAGLYLSGEGPYAIGREPDPWRRACDIGERMHELVFRVFRERCRFFEFEFEDNEKARKWGLKFSYRFKLWYCPKGVKVTAALKRREVSDLDVWLQTKVDREIAEQGKRRKKRRKRFEKYGTVQSHIAELKKGREILEGVG